MRTTRIAVLIAALMCGASVGAVVARPGTKIVDARQVVSFEALIPRQFGDWREDPRWIAQVVNPQAQKMLDELYSEVLTRTYVNAAGYRIMLSLAYGADQQRSVQAHKPEACYAGQGFTLHGTRSSQLATPFGDISIQRMFATRGPREEPVTYWWKVGDKLVQGDVQRKLAELSYTMTGRIPDGLLFRVSSVDRDGPRANRLHDQFILQLLETVSPAERKRLTGLGNPQS